MHYEQVTVTRQILDSLSNGQQVIIAVGTTSMRTLESIYWFGVKLLSDPQADFSITQHDPYQLPDSISTLDAVNAVMQLIWTQKDYKT
jgi:S-adenosylmethionine:tRNA ribosyltransferase-isomerase